MNGLYTRLLLICAIMVCNVVFTKTIVPVPRDFTVMQLKEFDGGDTTSDEINAMTEKQRASAKSIYIAYEGIVYDVSHVRAVYGKGGIYHHFAGRDLSLITTGNVMQDGAIGQVPSDVDMNVEHWLKSYGFNDPVVGRVTTPPTGLKMTKTEFNKLRDGKKDTDTMRVDLPVYVIINRRIIDVSYGGMKSYGPGGSYGILAWKDITLALATMALEPGAVDKSDNMPFDKGIKGLTSEEVKALAQWENMFMHTKKYPIVGRIIDN